MTAPFYLHEAMVEVLRGRGEMTAREIAHRDLYRRDDGDHPQANQIHARASNRRDLFERNNRRIRLHPTE